jgi:hypothetical protein
MIIALLILLLLFFAPDFYIFGAFLRHAPLVWRILFFVPSVLGFASLFGMRFYGFTSVFGTIFLVALLCFALPKLAFTVISLIARLFGIWSASAFTVGNLIGVGVAFLVSLMALYGLVFGWKQLEVEHVDLYFDNLPEAYDGYRIAHLSDLHVGTYKGKTAFVEKVVRLVNEENPDLVVFTGDLVNTDPEEIQPFVSSLSSFTARDGVVSVLGNHDYCLYGNPDRWSHPREGGLKVAEIERSMGWKVLMNESYIMQKDGERIAIVGVENRGKRPFPQIGDLRAAVECVTDYDTTKCDDNIFAVLLSHDPSQWRMEVLPMTHIPLMLSGHTHAAQVKIGKWSPSSWMYKEWGGAYQSGNQQLYISEGLGGTLPFRFGARPQIVILTLHRK